MRPFGALGILDDVAFSVGPRAAQLAPGIARSHTHLGVLPDAFDFIRRTVRDDDQLAVELGAPDRRFDPSTIPPVAFEVDEAFLAQSSRRIGCHGAIMVELRRACNTPGAAHEASAPRPIRRDAGPLFADPGWLKGVATARPILAATTLFPEKPQ